MTVERIARLVEGDVIRELHRQISLCFLRCPRMAAVNCHTLERFRWAHTLPCRLTLILPTRALPRGYSVELNSQMAMPSITRPSAAITPASSSPGTCQPHQVTPGSRARRAAGEIVTSANL